MERTTVYFRSGTLRRLRSHARRTGRKQAELIRDAVERELASEPVDLPSCVGAVSVGGPDAATTKRQLREQWPENALVKR